MPAYAQLGDDQMPRLPVPGVMVHLSPEFTPARLQGITIHPDNALQFDFLIHKGDQELELGQKREEYKKLVKYFLASLTIPDEDQWVNLSPYEKDRIIKDDFGKTEMGRDLLAEDYLLKQITSSLIYPEDGLGKKFWAKIYERAWNEYHTTNIPVNTFNKVWIVPDQAYVYESGNTAYILKSHLKVMLEEDYLSLEKHSGTTSSPASTHTIGSQVIRAIILPELEREVNEGKNFANLRQMYSGMILATWYKKALKESLLGKVYVDKKKVVGVNSQDPKVNEEIYQRYLKAFKKGVFNYIKEDVDKYTNEAIPRKYFSGGWDGFHQTVSVVPGTNFSHSDGVLFIADPATIRFIPKIDTAALASVDSLDRAIVAFNPAGEILKRSNAAMKAGVLREYVPGQIYMTLQPMFFSIFDTLPPAAETNMNNYVPDYPRDNSTDIIVVYENNGHLKVRERIDIDRLFQLRYPDRQNDQNLYTGLFRDMLKGTLNLTPEELDKSKKTELDYNSEQKPVLKVIIYQGRIYSLDKFREKLNELFKKERQALSLVAVDKESVPYLYWAIDLAEWMRIKERGYFEIPVRTNFEGKVGPQVSMYKAQEGYAGVVIRIPNKTPYFRQVGFQRIESAVPLFVSAQEIYVSNSGDEGTFIPLAEYLQSLPGTDGAMTAEDMKMAFLDTMMALWGHGGRFDNNSLNIFGFLSLFPTYLKTDEEINRKYSSNKLKNLEFHQQVLDQSIRRIEEVRGEIREFMKGPFNASKSGKSYDEYLNEYLSQFNMLINELQWLDENWSTYTEMIEEFTTPGLFKTRLEEYAPAISRAFRSVLPAAKIIVKVLQRDRGEAQTGKVELKTIFGGDIKKMLKIKGENTIEVEVHFYGDGEFWVDGDGDVLFAAFERIIENAAAVKGAGKITIIFTKIGNNIHFEMENKGRIPEERLQRTNIELTNGKIIPVQKIFLLDLHRERMSEGGVGLSFLWHVIRLYGGTIEVKNSVNSDQEPIVRFTGDLPNTSFVSSATQAVGKTNMSDNAMRSSEQESFIKGREGVIPGGIDFNSANLNLQIKRDGNGVPLPLAQQDMAQLSRIQGFEPEIIEIRPAVNVPIISELQQKLQSSSI
jgi:hypothetical protein